MFFHLLKIYKLLLSCVMILIRLYKSNHVDAWLCKFRKCFSPFKCSCLWGDEVSSRKKNLAISEHVKSCILWYTNSLRLNIEKQNRYLLFRKAILSLHRKCTYMLGRRGSSVKHGYFITLIRISGFALKRPNSCLFKV